MKDSGKLIKDEKMQLIQWLAEFNSLSQCQLLLLENFNKNLTVQAIHKYLQNYEAEIALMRGKYLEDISELPIAHKKMRLLWRGKMASDILKRSDTEKYHVVNRILDSVALELKDYTGDKLKLLDLDTIEII